MSIAFFIRLMRVHQYIKNFFIFSPLFFAGKIENIDLLIKTIIAFFSFSIASSGIYIFNDYCDIQEDKQHPQKKERPLASGEITKAYAIFFIIIFILFGAATMSLVSYVATGILISYIFLNIAYSMYLKHIAILDVTIVAIGFVLRLFIGAAVTDIALSKWIVIMTFLLALFLALAKRRDDILVFLKTGKITRKNIDGYSLQFLDTSIAVTASIVVVAYTIYAINEVNIVDKNDYLYLTAFFVVVGILRYLQIIFVEENSGSPTKIILKDRVMQLVIIGWITTFLWIIYK